MNLFKLTLTLIFLFISANHNLLASAIPNNAPAKPEGGGVSTERYKYIPFNLAFTYPKNWIVDGVASDVVSSQPTSQVVCKELLKVLPDGFKCEEVVVQNTSSPASYARFLYLKSSTISDLESVKSIAQKWQPQIDNWTSFDFSRYAPGWTHVSSTIGAPKAIVTHDAYLTGPGLAVLMQSVAHETGEGVYGTTLMRNTMTRESEGLKLLYFKSERQLINAGQWNCYTIGVFDESGSPKSPPKVTLSKAYNDLKVVSNVTVNKQRSDGKETVFRACLSTSPYVESGRGALSSISIMSNTGNTIDCGIHSSDESLLQNPNLTKLVCTPGIIARESIDSKSQIVEGTSSEILNKNRDNFGPTLLSILFDERSREIVIQASDTNGLGSVKLFTNDTDGAIAVASDWNGPKFNPREKSWMLPLDLFAKKDGIVRIPVTQFPTKGAVVLRGGALEDTVGNKTFFFLPKNKTSPLYDLKQDGIKTKQEVGKVVTWIAQ